MSRPFFLISSRDHFHDDMPHVQKKYFDKPGQNPENEQNEPQIHLNTKDKKIQYPIPKPGVNECVHGGLAAHQLEKIHI